MGGGRSEDYVERREGEREEGRKRGKEGGRDGVRNREKKGWGGEKERGKREIE